MSIVLAVQRSLSAPPGTRQRGHWFNDTTTFTAVQSGPDETELQTLDLGAASWDGAGGKSGDAAAQSVINASKFPADQGDKIQSVPPKPPDHPNL